MVTSYFPNIQEISLRSGSSPVLAKHSQMGRLEGWEAGYGHLSLCPCFLLLWTSSVECWTPEGPCCSTIHLGTRAVVPLLGVQSQWHPLLNTGGGLETKAENAFGLLLLLDQPDFSLKRWTWGIESITPGKENMGTNWGETGKNGQIMFKKNIQCI